MADEHACRHDRWRHRRRRLDAAVALHTAGIAYLTVWGADTALHRTIADGLIISLTGLLLGYIIAPVADDWLQRRGGNVDPT